MYHHVTNNSIPFASSMPYVIVFKMTVDIPDVDPTRAEGYQEEESRRDLAAMKEKLLPRYAKCRPVVNYSWGNQNKYVLAVLEILKTDPGVHKVFQNKVWAEKFFDEGFDISGLVKGGGMTQATLDKVNILVDEFDKGFPVDEQTARDWFDRDIDRWMEEASHKTPAGYFWNITRNLGELFALMLGGKAPVIWTGIMRSLGYEGFTDRSGIGLIHGNEPCQAVFFSLKAIKLVEILPNVRKSKRGDWKDWAE